MLDSCVVRVAAVFGGLGFLVFFFSSAGISEANRGTVQWVMLGGLALMVSCGVVIGLAWALDSKGGPHG